MSDRAVSSLAGQSLVILGDSYSTFAGCVPEGHYLYYPTDGIPDVARKEDTWWHQLVTRLGLRLLLNDSSSGTTVSTSVRPEHRIEDAFVRRMRISLNRNARQGEQPDWIILFGGTNDSWMDVPVGSNQWEGWTETDLKTVLPAFCCMVDYVKEENPRSRILAVINTDLKPEIAAGMEEACEHFGILSIALHGIDKCWGHPTRLGMRQIADQVAEGMLASCGAGPRESLQKDWFPA